MTLRGKPFRSRLILTTALAGGLLLPAAALAQTVNGVLPNVGDATFNPAQVAISGGGPTAGSTLDVSIKTQSAVIDWFHFDVPATDTVNFTNNASVPVAAVLNRVRAGGAAVAAPSIIDGKINAPGVEVWLQNPEGILFGSGVAINAAGFVATAAEIDPADFLDGNTSFRLVADPGSVAKVSGGGAGANFITTGGKLAFIAPAVAVSGNFDAGTGSVAFVTATDVTMTANPGSPLGLTIARGTSVGTDAQVVGGTVNGGEAYFVLATRDTVVDSLLNVTAAVTANAAVANGRGVTLVAGSGPTAAPGVAITGSAADVGGAAAIQQDGVIEANGVGQQVYMRSSGAITGTAAVTAENNVSVETPGDIALGDVTSLKGAVDIFGGSIATNDVLVGGTTATFGASAGAIALGSVKAVGDVTITGFGTEAIDVTRATQSTAGAIIIEGNGPVTLGSTESALATTIGAVTPPSAITIGTTAKGALLDFHTSGLLKTGALTAATGPITATAATMDIASATASADAITLTASGASLKLGSASAGTGIAISAPAAAVTTDSLSTAAGDIVLTGGSLAGIAAAGADLAAPKGKITVTTSGGAVMRDLSASGAIAATGAAVTARNVTGGDTLALTTTGGPLRIEGNAVAAGNVTLAAAGAAQLSSVTSSGGAVSLTATGAVSGIGAGAGDISAHNAVTVSSGDAVTLDALSGSGVSVSGRSASVNSALAAAGDVSVTATAGAATLGGATASNDVLVHASGTASVSGAITAGRDYDVSGASVTLGSGTQQAGRRVRIAATTGSITGGNGLTLIGDASGSGAANGVVLDAANGAITLGGSRLLGGTARSSDVALRVAAGSPIVLGDMAARSFGMTDAGYGPVTAISHNAAITTGNIDSTNAVSITTSSGNLTTGNVRTYAPGANVSLRTTGGNLSVDTVNATGSATLAGSGSVEVNAVTASGGDVQVAAGTTLTGRSGGRANLSATAGDVTATAGGAALLGAVSGRSVVVQAGSIDATSVTATTGTLGLTATAGGITAGAINTATDLSLTSSADLTLGSVQVTAGDAALTSTGGAVSIADNATIGGALKIAGNRVALGVDAGSETIAATGAIDITARAGSITGGDGLTLRSDSGGVGGRNLILDATGGDIAFASSSVVQAGPAQQSAIGIRLGSASGNASFGTLSAARVGQVDAGHASLSPIVIGGSFTAGPVTTRQAFDLDAAGGITLGNVTVSDAGAAIRLASNGTIATGALSAPGQIGVTAGGATTLGDATSAAAGVTVRGTSVSGGTLTAASALDVRSTGGALSLAGGTAGTTAALDAAGPLTVTNTLSGTNGVTAKATGAATIGTVRSTGGAVSVDAASNTIGTATAGGALSIEARAGASTVGTAQAGGTARIGSTGDTTLTTGVTSVGNATITGANVRLTSAAASAGSVEVTATGGVSGVGTGARANLSAGGAGNDVRVTAGGPVLLGTVTAPDEVALRGTSVDATSVTATGGALSLTATAGDATLGTGTAGGAAAITASGAASVTSLSGAGVSVQAGTTLNAATLTSSGNIQTTSTAGASTLGTLTATGSVTVNGAGVNATRLVAGTTLGVTSGGAVTIGSAQAGGAATIDAAGAATLGAITAGPSLSIRATDATITGTQRASRVTFTNRTPATTALRLGDGTVTDGFRLSAAELGMVETDALVLDGGSGAVEIGTLAFGTATGRNTVDVLSTGRIDIRGAVSGAGAGRVFRFGGSAANTTDRATTIQIATTANGGGRLLFGTADLELRGTRIAQGQNAGFLDALGALSPADVAARFINNPGSSLYSSTVGGAPYDPANATILTANRLTVRYSDYALFQNTGQIGENLGMVINTATGSAPSLNLIGTGDGAGIGGVALYGTVNGIGGVAAALLGPPDVAATNVNLRAGRINGCLINSGAGCLTNVVAQPVLNVFDASRTQILRAAENLAVPFDPVVGTNNEALFSGVSSIDAPPDESAPAPQPQCTENSTDPNCPKQESKQ